MAAIASLEDLEASQEDLLEAKDLGSKVKTGFLKTKWSQTCKGMTDHKCN